MRPGPEAAARRVSLLEHNLNARALGALTREIRALSTDVDALVADMQKASAEADAYLKTMEQTEN